MNRFTSPSARWLVPAAIGLGLIGSANLPNMLPAGATTPTLPTLTPAELLAKAQAAKVSTLSGTVRITTRLGLPDLGSLTNGAPSSVTALLSGVHDITVAADGPDHLRVTRSDTGTEADWIRNGDDVWAWDSTRLEATHLTLGPGGHEAADTTTPEQPAATETGAPPDPVTMAKDLLAKVTPTTQVSVRSPRYVAGLAAYELVLAPNDAASTVKEVVIAVDAGTGLPLDVRVSSKRTDPAFEVAFTEVSFAKPNPSRFTFTPPPGATVVQVATAAELLGTGGGRHGDEAPDTPEVPAAGETAPQGPATKVVGTSWTSVAIVSGQQVPGALDTLLRSAPTISVGSHTARLISTSLVNALVLDDGRIVVGAVTPETLQATAVAS
jgi:outer membrane lipoprotein-sorting protein